MDYGLLKARGTLSGNIFNGGTTLGPTGGPAFQGLGDDGASAWDIATSFVEGMIPGASEFSTVSDVIQAATSTDAEATQSGDGGYSACVADGKSKWYYDASGNGYCEHNPKPDLNCWPTGVGPQPPGTKPLPACTAAQVAQIGKDPNGPLVAGPPGGSPYDACVLISGGIDPNCVKAVDCWSGKGTWDPKTLKCAKAGGTGPTPKPILPTPAPVVEDASVWSSPLLWGGLLLAAGVGVVVYKKRKAKKLGYR